MNATSLSAPQIGFDRLVLLEWAAAALRTRAGTGQPGDLEALLDGAGLGVEARKKTKTVINRLWVAPRPALVDFADRGAAILRADPDASIRALCWGMAIASYPFFGKCAELAGRLFALQGDFAPSELHRRMSETFGEREGTRRATNHCILTQADWGALAKTENGKRVTRPPQAAIVDAPLAAWLIEAATRHAGRPIPLASLHSNHSLYPFLIDVPAAYVVSSSPNLELRQEGMGNQFAALRQP
jgi:hypothetical protein